MPVVKRDEFITNKQAAEFTGLSPNTQWNWHGNGKIGVHRHLIFEHC